MTKLIKAVALMPLWAPSDAAGPAGSKPTSGGSAETPGQGTGEQGTGGQGAGGQGAGAQGNVTTLTGEAIAAPPATSAPAKPTTPAPTKPAPSAPAAAAPNWTPPTVHPPAPPARVRRHHMGLIFSFILLVLVPWVAGGAYLWTAAEDRYSSVAGFTVRQAEGAPASS